MRDDRDYKIELSNAEQQAAEPRRDTRPFLSVHFACCNAYCRIYRNLDETRYEGRCPRCSRAVTFAVGSHGVESRFFIVK